MVLQVAAGPSGLLENKTHRFAVLFRIERTDGQRYFFTSTPSPIVFQGNTYSPSGGFSVSARRQQSGLHPKNLEARGVINSSNVTVPDLSEGRFDEAEVTEYIIDWLYPFAEPFKTTKYWITEVTWDGEAWSAQMEGQTRWLRNKVGLVFTRNCRHDLGNGLTSGS